MIGIFAGVKAGYVMFNSMMLSLAALSSIIIFLRTSVVASARSSGCCGLGCRIT